MPGSGITCSALSRHTGGTEFRPDPRLETAFICCSRIHIRHTSCDYVVILMLCYHGIPIWRGYIVIWSQPYIVTFAPPSIVVLLNHFMFVITISKSYSIAVLHVVHCHMIT